MLIECSSCKKKYKIDDSKIPPGGLKVSCKQCRNIISIDGAKTSTSKLLDDIVKKTGDLPPMPHIAMKVVELVQENSLSAKEEIQKVISQDQGLTAQILKFSNSSLYSRSRSIQTLSEAIVVLGYDTIKNLVLASSTKAVYKRKGQIGLLEKNLWEHSVATAIGGKIIASQLRTAKVEEAFIGGLLHDIGKVILSQGAEEEYSRIVQNVYNSEDSFVEEEKRILGFDHTMVGYLVVNKWNFTDDLVKGIRYHHQLSKVEKNKSLIPIISFADNIANKNGFGIRQESSSFETEAAKAAKFLGLDRKEVEKLEKKMVAAFEADKEMMQIQ